jgi:hypothetical protein
MGIRAIATPRRLHDVREGWIGRERALAVYGVALTDSGEAADLPATEARRRAT